MTLDKLFREIPYAGCTVLVDNGKDVEVIFPTEKLAKRVSTIVKGERDVKKVKWKVG